MERNRSLFLRSCVFAGVALVAAGIVLARPSHEIESTPTKSMPTTFPTIDLDKIGGLEVEKTVTKDGKPVKESVRVARRRKKERVQGLAPDASGNLTISSEMRWGAPGAWTVTSVNEYPAAASKIEDALKALSNVRTLAEPTSTASKFSQFADAEGFANVRVLGWNEASESEDPDAVLVSFGVGKSNAEGSWSNMFLRVDDTANAKASSTAPLPGKIVAVNGLEYWKDRTTATSWIETRLFPGLTESDVTETSWVCPAKSYEATIVRVAKPATKPDGAAMDGADHGMDGGKDDKPSDADKEDSFTLTKPATPEPAVKKEPGKQIVQGFVGLRMAGLEGAAPADADTKYGFDKPDVIVSAKGRPQKEGAAAPTYRLELGKKVEGKSTLYARRSLSGVGDPWVFTVEDYEVSRFRDDPKDLLEKKPEPPPTPPAPPATPEAGMTEPSMGEPPAGTPPAAPPANPPTPASPPPAPAPPAMGESPAPPAMEGEPPSMPAMGDAPPAPAMGDDAAAGMK